MKKFFAGFFLVMSTSASAAGQDSDFIAMRQAYQAGNAPRVAIYAQRLRGHVLEPYAVYYQLRPQLRNQAVSSEAISQFAERYRDSPLSDKLQSEWLKKLGRAEQWELFAEGYPILKTRDAELICYSFQQRIWANDMKAYDEARPLWFTARDLPESCTPVFDTLISANVLADRDIWARLRLALEAGNVGVARFVNQYLFDDQKLDDRRLREAADNPLRYLERHRGAIKTQADREIALFAMQRLLRSGPDQAHAYWARMRPYFSEAEHSYFLVQLADQAARRLHPRALEWFIEAARSTAPAVLTDAQLGWKARAALRAGNWALVSESIQAMSSQEQQTGVWRYWNARALKAAGKTMEANTILGPLSSEHNFYGQLAEEELGLSMGIPDSPYKPTKDEIAAMERRPGIRRALTLYRLNLRTEAANEWAWTVRDLDDRQLLASAEVARRNGIYDRAIYAADRTVQQHDFSLRFPAPHRDTLSNILKQQELDEAWVYGLIRQESRFVSDARSSAGAMGLMQLMPATAKWVAKQVGIRQYRPGLVTEVNTNLKLGTYYLRHVLELTDDQPLLASAAYNAGPSRAWQWRDEKPLEGAIYAETIPFNETRDYVKKVMSNSMYYARTFGHQIKALKQRLGIVASKSNGQNPPEDEITP